MASPFQQQARQRKLIYIGLILALFTLSLVWRTTVIARQADQLALREEKRGEADLIGSLARQGLTGSRGLVICVLWSEAMEKQKKNQWNELEVVVRALTKLQPHFITPWLFQSWNLSYNVSVESDRVRDKYFYISRGLELLGEGERQNRDHPDLRWSIGFFTQHKICQSDERNYHRSLFQLSLIPPNERDPARFWTQEKDEPVFNWEQFRQFVEKHPQLIRRLRVGISMGTEYEKKQLFTCETPKDVVQFLDDNYHVPSLYRVAQSVSGEGGGGAFRVWNRNKSDELLPPGQRFPVLPPPHQKAFDAEALTYESAMDDSKDAYEAAHAWFCYAQEPLPLPDRLPGSSEPITDPVHQRRPRHMTTLIFRNYPCQGRRYMAERLQEEGWYDDEAWDTSDWFEKATGGLAGKQVKVGGGKQSWSLEAWKKAAYSWEQHGKDNHLMFRNAAEEKNYNDLAARFAKRFGMLVGSSPPPVRVEELTKAEKDEYEAAKFLFEYQFYRGVSNFPHHLIAARVEAKPETVACRKLFYQAERLNLTRSPGAALEVYQTPLNLPAWGGYKVSDPGAAILYSAVWAAAGPRTTVADLISTLLRIGTRTDQRRPPNPLEAWRDLVLLRNREFRIDANTQEQTAGFQIRYIWLYNRRAGKDLKEDIGKMSKFLPLVPKFTQDTFRPPIFVGPFDYKVKETPQKDQTVKVELLPLDSLEEGRPLIETRYMEATLDRMHLPVHRRQTEPPTMPPPGMRPPGGRKPPTPPGPKQGPGRP